jgi:peptidoglycan/LPS O-acetylase OafA/YrhL
VLAVHVLGFLGILPPDSPLMRVGRFGLRLFFVHTSLVLMYSMARRYHGESWRAVFGHFIVRRCFRIYPLSMLVVLVVFLFRIPAAHVAAWSMQHIAVGLPGLLANLLLVQNLTYTPSIAGQLWSLPLEMQMYLLLPFLFLLVRRGLSTRALVGLWVGAVALTLVQPLISGRLSLAQFVPSFLPGVIAYRLSATRRAQWSGRAWPFVLCGLAAVYAVTESFEHGWVLCLLAGLALPRFQEIDQAWLRRVAHVGAKYSYGVYLTHLFAVWVGFMALAGLPMMMRWVVFLGLSIGLPVLLYHTIEAPMIRYGARLADRWFPRAVGGVGQGAARTV